MPHWTVIWSVVGIVESGLVGMMASVLGMNPPEFKLACRCLWSAALFRGATTFVGSVETENTIEAKWAIAIVALAVGILLPWGLSWIREKESSYREAMKFSRTDTPNASRATESPLWQVITKAAAVVGLCAGIVTLAVNLQPPFWLAKTPTQGPRILVNPMPSPTATASSTPLPPPATPNVVPPAPPTPTPPTGTPTPTPAPPLPGTPTLVILNPQVNHIHTKQAVSDEVMAQLVSYFKAHDYVVTRSKGGLSLSQYVSRAAGGGAPQSEWAVQAIVEMNPHGRARRAGSPVLGMLPSNSASMVVDLTMSCAVMIRLVHLPLGDRGTSSQSQSEIVRTIPAGNERQAVQDADFSRAAAEKATRDALAKLRIELTQ